jgi:hypothetical protein
MDERGEGGGAKKKINKKIGVPSISFHFHPLQGNSWKKVTSL